VTFFQIADEYERDFEPLEQDDFEGCVYASALFVQMGHMCARQMTDGRMTPAMLKKRLSLWPDDRREQAIAHLVELGQWRQTETGYEFVDWDLTQYTKAQETRRRALAAERQRQRRRRLAEAALPNEVSGVHSIPASRVTEPPSRVTEPALHVVSPAMSRADAANTAKPRTKPLKKPEMSRVTSRSPLPLPLFSDQTDTACPVPAAPAPVANLAKVRTRKQTEADVLRDRVVEIFNQEYQPLHHIRAVPGRTDYALLALATQSYCPEGTLDEALVRKSVRAYLKDPSWRNFGGYNLRSWATHHARGLTREEPNRGFFVNV
jgi:hypothetical protein